MATKWFSLSNTGTPTDPGDYTALPGLPTCASGSDQICAIEAEEDTSSQPVIDDALKDAMIEALHTRTNQPNVQLRVDPNP
ncbi:MAG TPA: hypothetical protein VNQ80_08195 [Parapedobacter sp.]|uniref:hypothetical protein n=1 Tax=Parapedobacter sp. TaxID=1958893 RepID=UPI002C52E200|nr:hypothetical protein [Parapedobacter sp.]HWK57302.1 hypothetical protein [Parapedobacter sp.]